MRIRWRRILGLLALAILVVVAAGGTWLVLPQRLLPEATAALASTPDVTFTQAGDRLEFAPARGQAPAAGLVIYPGAKVEAAGYAPTAAAIARAGYLVVVVPMPLNLAFLGSGRFAEVKASHPAIRTWALAGHSLGGAMAGQYAAEHPGEVAAIAFWASYPNGNLASSAIPATVIYGTLDGGAAKMTSDATKATLPAGTAFVAIEGGNHEQMGWYTGQAGDPVPSISREEQQRLLVGATLDLLAKAAPAP